MIIFELLSQDNLLENVVSSLCTIVFSEYLGCIALETGAYDRYSVPLGGGGGGGRVRSPFLGRPLAQFKKKIIKKKIEGGLDPPPPPPFLRTRLTRYIY